VRYTSGQVGHGVESGRSCGGPRHDLELGRRRGALPDRRAQAVGTGVAAADDDDVLAARADRRRLQVALLHPVGGHQVLHRQVDAGELAARAGRSRPRVRPAGQQHRVVLLAELVDGDVDPDVDAGRNVVPSARICSSRRSRTASPS
jgi:hypothetical protein